MSRKYRIKSRGADVALQLAQVSYAPDAMFISEHGLRKDDELGSGRNVSEMWCLLA